MSDESLENAPDHLMDQSGIPITTAPDSFSSDSLENPRVATLSSEVRRLNSWLGVLTGISILSIGLLAGFAFWLKHQQDQMQQQLSVVNAYKSQIESMKTLESRVNILDNQAKSLNQNVQVLNQEVSKGLPTQIKGVQNDLSSVKASVQSVRAALQQEKYNPVPREQQFPPLAAPRESPATPFPLPKISPAPNKPGTLPLR